MKEVITNVKSIENNLNIEQEMVGNSYIAANKITIISRVKLTEYEEKNIEDIFNDYLVKIGKL